MDQPISYLASAASLGLLTISYPLFRLQLESMIDDGEDGEQDFGRKLTHIVKIGYLRTRDNKVHKMYVFFS